LVPTIAGLQPGGTSLACVGFTVIRIQVVPGYPNPVSLSGDLTEVVLDPNVGDISKHSAWSEKWERSDPLGANGLTVNINFDDWFDVEIVLMSGWQKQTSIGAVAVAAVPWQLVSNTLDIGDLPGTLPASSYLFDLHIKKAPWPWYDSKDELDDGQGNALGVLFPNSAMYSWSEEIAFGPGNGATNITIWSDSGNWDQVTYDFLSPLSGVGSIPAAMASLSAQIGGYVGGVGNVPIARGYVKRLRVQVIPGGAGKIYIGAAGMDTSAFTGVYAILYPNAVGRWSETLEIEDAEGDGISSDDLCIQSEVLGERAIVSTMATGVAPPDGVLTVKASGPLAGSFSSYAVPFATSSTPVSILRAQAIPGGDGRLWIGTAGMTAAQPDGNFASVLKVLWPSQGNYDVGEGFSERFTQECHAGPASASNCLDLQNYTFWPYIPSEQLLVFALGR
jgi:hypothetical protein